MDISISNETFTPQIQPLPLNGKDIAIAIETVKLAIEVVKSIGNAIMALARESGIIPNMELKHWVPLCSTCREMINQDRLLKWQQIH